MPIGSTSRYAGLPFVPVPDAEGNIHPTISMRPDAPPDPAAPSYTHMVMAGETMETLAHRYYGNSAAWWRIAEANPLLFPSDLKPGAKMVIPSAAEVGRVTRTRTF